MRAHRTDLVSLTFGLLFVGLAGWWLVARLLGFVLPPVGWFLAGALLLIGVLGLVGALRAARSAGSTAPDAPAGVPPAAPVGAGSPVAAATSGQPVTEAPFGEFDRIDDPDRRPGQREWEVSAPVSGAGAREEADEWPSPPRAGGAGAEDTDEWPGAPGDGGREEADEWPTAAVTDRRDEAVEDRSADVPGDGPAAPPAGGDRR